MKSQILLAFIGFILIALSTSKAIIVVNEYPRKEALSCTHFSDECDVAPPKGHMKVCVFDQQENGKCLWHDSGNKFHPVNPNTNLRNLLTRDLQYCDTTSDCDYKDWGDSCFFGLGICVGCRVIGDSAYCAADGDEGAYDGCCLVNDW